MPRAMGAPRPWTVLVLPAAVLAATAGCAGVFDPEPLEVLSYEGAHGDHRPAGALEGTLDGTVAEDRACLWLRPDEDTPGPRQYLLAWPEGYAAVDDPLRVVDEGGRVVLTVGDEVELNGAITSQTSMECGGESGPQWSAAPVEAEE